MSAPSHAQPYQRPLSNPSHWNGAPGAVQVPSNDSPTASTQQAGTNTDGKDAIREGKQRAKETMAAAEANVRATAALTQSSAGINGSAQPNGGPPLSRKRSRDGTRLPLAQSSNTTPKSDDAHTTHSQVLLERYMASDLLHGAAMNDQAERSRELIKGKEMELHQVRQRRNLHPAAVFGGGYMGYGNRITDGKCQIVYSADRAPPKGRRSRELYIPRKDNAQQAEQNEELVPVRLDIELDKLRLRDAFTWNLHEKLISQDTFTDYLLEDLQIPPESCPEVARQVKAEIQEQIQNYYPHIIVQDGPLEQGRPYSEHKDDEMRIQIKVNITLGRITLLDQFEWDINNPHNSPEEFARQMARENALSGEFTTAIAHTIREQSQLYTKSLYLTNHCFDGRPVEDPDLKDGFLPAPIHSAFRPPQAQKDWMPVMYEMNDAELERTETSMMREHRANKRQLNRRGGPALPDLKDRPRTIRSLIVHSVIPGAAHNLDTTGIPKLRRSGTGGRGNRRRVTDGADLDSDDLDSDDSATGPADSPAPSSTPAAALLNNPGTARTRGMRGAAQAAMRANASYARSTTPDALTQHLPPPTTSSSMLHDPPSARPSTTRRSFLPDDRVEPDKLVVRLRIGKAKFRAWDEGVKARERASKYPLTGYASASAGGTHHLPVGSSMMTSGRAAAATAGMSTTTPSMAPRAPPQGARQQMPQLQQQPNGHASVQSNSSISTAVVGQASGIQYDSGGRVEVDKWPHVDDIPPPPSPWLREAIQILRTRHPDSDFDPVMRPYTTNITTHGTEKVPMETGALAPAGMRIQYLPRIRCNDCPGKLYTASRGRVVEEFEVHLRNRNHRERVAERQGR